MRKHRCHGGVKVARFPGMLEVSGSIPVSGLCFLLIFVVFTLCLPCHSSLLSACTVKRGALSTASCMLYAVSGCQDCACALLSFGPDKDSIEGRSVVGSAWMSGMRLRVVIVWAAVVRVVLRWYKYITVPYSFVTLIGRAPPALHLKSYNIVHLCVLIVG